MLTGTVVIPGMGKKDIFIKTKNGKPNDIVIRAPFNEPIEKPVFNYPMGPIRPIGWHPMGPKGPWDSVVGGPNWGPIVDSRPVIHHPIVPIGHRPIVRPLGPMLTPEEVSDVKKKDFFTKVFETHKKQVDKFKAPIVGK